jgi:prepilin-type N-terminal cleavage/methylation domain-containing protein
MNARRKTVVMEKTAPPRWGRPGSPLRNTHDALRGGFTLIEVVTVITIIALLAGMLIAGAMYANERAGRARTSASIKKIEMQLESYKADWGAYPRDHIGTSLRSFAGGRRTERTRQAPYGTGVVDPAESLWYHLEHAMLDLGKKAYISFPASELVDRDNDRSQEVADAFGYPLNFKSNNPDSYGFTTKLVKAGAGKDYEPRHNRTSVDLCSYGRNATTWKTYTPQTRVGTEYAPSEINFGGGTGTRPHNFYFTPFNALGTRAGEQYSFGGEGDDDVNNWQQR